MFTSDETLHPRYYVQTLHLYRQCVLCDGINMFCCVDQALAQISPACTTPVICTGVEQQHQSELASASQQSEARLSEVESELSGRVKAVSELLNHTAKAGSQVMSHVANLETTIKSDVAGEPPVDR